MRPGSLIAVIGVFLISILGYIAMQQYIERTMVMEKSKNGMKEKIDFEMLNSIEIVTKDKEPGFISTHSDGLPVDYMVPAHNWPPLKKSHKIYLFKEGCVLTTKPKESCNRQIYVVLNNAQKQAFYIRELDDLPLAVATIETEKDALKLAQFITSPAISQYFGIYFVNLLPTDDEESATIDHQGYHLFQDSWDRLELPMPEIKRTQDKKFAITRTGFVPFGEKQIVTVRETVSPEGNYNYEVLTVLYQGNLVPIKVKPYR